jgi:dTDP-4-amino-4,6-dideoxygalactose transaminase
MSSQSKVPLFKVHVPTDAALEQIRNVFASGFINEGEQVTELTNKLSERWLTKNLSLTNSCTSALTIALHLAKKKTNPYNDYGMNVITTPMTCVATNTPIIATGANIVWTDIDSRTGMILPKNLEKQINDHTIAVMAVAWGGTPPPLRELRDVCDYHNVPLILDAAHAFDARYAGDFIHEWADFTCYSFQAIKHFTTGDGGALVCRSVEDNAKAKALKWFGLDRDHAKDAKGNWKGQQWDVDIVEAGYKFNMNNIAAAIGISQLDHIDEIIALHRRNAKLYDVAFESYKNVVPLQRPADSESSHWVYGMRVASTSKISRDDLLKRLNDDGIMAGLVHVPNDDYTAFKQYKTKLVGVRRFASCQFALPCGWWVSEDDVTRIANRVKELTS